MSNKTIKTNITWVLNGWIIIGANDNWKKSPTLGKNIPKKMNENISKLKHIYYVKIVLKNILKLHKKSYNIEKIKGSLHTYIVYNVIYI